MDVNEILAISAIINGFTAFSFGAVVFWNGRKNITNIVFTFFTFFIWLWSFGYYFWLKSEYVEVASFWIGILNFGSTFIPITYYHWISLILGNKRKVLIYLGYVASALFSIFSFSKLYVSDFVSIRGFDFWPVAGSLYLYYVLILYGGFFIFGLLDSIIAIRRGDNKTKDIAKLILAASLISWISGASNFPLWFGIEVPPFGNFLVFVHVFLFSYAMMKYNLMNMKTLSIQIAASFIIAISIVEIFMSKSIPETLTRILLFCIIIFFSYLLVKSSKEEIKRKEELEMLTKKLERNNQKLKELDRAKNEFISITAHQLRTPPTVIKGYIALALEDADNNIDKGTRESLERALVSNERLIDLIEDILNVSRIDSGNMKYEMKKNQLCTDVLSELYDAFALKAKDKGLKLILDKPKKPLPKMMMDSRRIREVVSNLVDNAIKYTRKGSIKISAKQVKDNIRIEIKDNGVGIAKDEMAYLFKKFSRGKNPDRLGAGGTGLGIFVGKKIVEDHGGKIWAESKGINKGSTFIIELPINLKEIKDIEKKRKKVKREAKKFVKGI